MENKFLQKSGQTSKPKSSGGIDYSYGQSADYFGGKDYEKALASGKSSAEVYSWLQNNKDKVREGNVEGKAGGLYERVKADASKGDLLLGSVPTRMTPNKEVLPGQVPTSQPKDNRVEAVERSQAFKDQKVNTQQNQQLTQDNDINTNITGDNNKVFNTQDNSIRQYGGDNRKLVINEGGGKGKSPYYTAADKAMTYATMGGFYDADDSPAAQASFVDQQRTMNRDAQKRYANVGSETAAKYAGTRGGDVNIKALQSRLDKNHNYFFDLATIQGVKTYGDRDAITKYPKFEFGDPIKPVESNAGKIADKYRDDIDDM